MTDVVLVVLRRPELAEALLRAAQRMAILMGGARVNALAVHETIEVSALAAEALMAEARSIEQARKGEMERIEALRAIFDRWKANHASDAHWTDEEGNPAALIAELGSRADLVVSGQPLEDDRVARRSFSAALFGTDRPVLLVPPGTGVAFGRRVAIAWRNERSAVRAIIPALRCLGQAEQVHVLAGVRERDARPGMPRVLLEHGVKAELHVLTIGSEPFGQTLLRAARQLGADMLVMGAYVHSPLREFILGGATRYVLDHADLPVLMRH